MLLFGCGRVAASTLIGLERPQPPDLPVFNPDHGIGFGWSDPYRHVHRKPLSVVADGHDQVSAKMEYHGRIRQHLPSAAFPGIELPIGEIVVLCDDRNTGDRAISQLMQHLLAATPVPRRMIRFNSPILRAKPRTAGKSEQFNRIVRAGKYDLFRSHLEADPLAVESHECCADETGVNIMTRDDEINDLTADGATQAVPTLLADCCVNHVSGSEVDVFDDWLAASGRCAGPSFDPDASIGHVADLHTIISEKTACDASLSSSSYSLATCQF